MAVKPMPAKRKDPLDVYGPPVRVAHEIVWEEPPPKRSTSSREIESLLAEVASRPGDWAKVCVRASTKLANSHSTSIRNLVKKRKLKVEVVARGAAVYVRVLR